MPERARANWCRPRLSATRQHRQPWAAALLVLCFACWPARPCGQDYDITQDWLSSLAVSNASNCSFPPLGPAIAPPPSCPPIPSNRRLSTEDVELLGYLLAPKVYMHEYEWSFLTDPETWLLQTPIYDRWFNPHNFTEVKGWYEEAPFQFLSVTGKEYFASRMFNGDFRARLTTQQVIDRVHGDPLDAQNKSTAKVWFSVGSPTESWNSNARLNSALVFNYNYFYPFNGCSNQMLAVSFKGKFQGIEYYMCSDSTGLHEGDWEHVALYTCTSDLFALLDNVTMQKDPVQVIKRAQYSQHSWNPEYNCSAAGECPSEVVDGFTRLVVYSGLFSHANYPTASPLWVYQQVDLGNLLANMDGLYIADRTSSNGPVFIPTRDNIRLMNVESTNSKWSWYLYPGSWGGYYPTTTEWCVQCFEDQLSHQGPCNTSNPAAYFLLKILNIKYPVINNMSALTWTSNLNPDLLAPIQGLNGPLYRTWTFNWDNPSFSPASGQWDAACPFTGAPKTSKSKDYDVGNPPEFLPFLLTVLALMVAAGVAFTLLLFFPSVANAKVGPPSLTLPSLRSFRRSPNSTGLSIGLVTQDRSHGGRLAAASKLGFGAKRRAVGKAAPGELEVPQVWDTTAVAPGTGAGAVGRWDAGEGVAGGSFPALGKLSTPGGSEGNSSPRGFGPGSHSSSSGVLVQLRAALTSPGVATIPEGGSPWLGATARAGAAARRGSGGAVGEALAAVAGPGVDGEASLTPYQASFSSVPTSSERPSSSGGFGAGPPGAPPYTLMGSDSVRKPLYSLPPSSSHGDTHTLASLDSSEVQLLAAPPHTQAMAASCLPKGALGMWGGGGARAAAGLAPSVRLCMSVAEEPPASVYYASRHLTWLILAMLVYVAGVVVTVLGVRDVVNALNDLYPDKLYMQLERGLVAVLGVFAFFELFSMLLVVFTRSHQQIALCVESWVCSNPFSRCKKADSCGYITQALVAGFLVIEINLCTVFFAVGFALWCIRFVFNYGCTTAFSTLFGLTKGIAADVCVNFGLIGLPDRAICGYELAQICSFWGNVRVQYMVYAAYLLAFSHIMFLGCVVHNMHTLRRWEAPASSS